MIGYVNKNTLINKLKNGLPLYMHVQCEGYGLFKKATSCFQCALDGEVYAMAFLDSELMQHTYRHYQISHLVEQYDDFAGFALHRIIDLMESDNINKIAVFMTKFTYHEFSIHELKNIDQFIEKPSSNLQIQKPEIEPKDNEFDKQQLRNYYKIQKQQIIKDLLNTFWDVEEYNLWEIDECCTLAYVVEKLCSMINGLNLCNSVIDEWKTLVAENKIADLSVSIANRAMIAILVDANIDKNDKQHVTKQFDEIRRLRNQSIISEFGMIGIKYAPDWFIEIQNEFFEQKRQELRDRFFAAAKKDNINSAEEIYQSLCLNDKPLLLELDYYLRHNKFKQREMLMHKNNIDRIVTAEQLHNKAIYQSIITTYYQFYQMRLR